MEELQNLKINIRFYRKKVGLSRKALAQKAKLSVYSIVDIELGRSKDIKLTTLLKIAKALNVKLTKLISSVKS